jgi:uncharacterized membrane protein
MALGADPARQILSEAEEERVLEAIRDAESATSGEIRVHVESRTADARADAERCFAGLGMAATAERNGVLFFLAVRDRKFAVIGDRGIHERVGDDYWTRLGARLETRFRAGEIALGLCEAIRDVGRELAAVFPRSPKDANELPDSISYGDDPAL